MSDTAPTRAEGAREAAAAWLRVYRLDIHEWADGSYPKLDTLTREFESFGRHAKADAEARAARAEAEVARLKAEADEALCLAEGPSTLLELARGSVSRGFELHEAQAEVARLMAENERMREALKPFVEHARRYADWLRKGIAPNPNDEHFAAARAALHGGENDR